MFCPNCDYEYRSGAVCPRCKVDTVIFDRTAGISDRLYNKGLAKAKISDITGAIECLRKSIKFNKNNIAAHNLIGLCYYEIGYVGEALKHWVVSNSKLKEQNRASYYIDEASKNGKVIEKLDNAVAMYNQALEYIKAENDDMAVIQLKKAVEASPRFVDAHNLLAFCSLIQGDTEKAVTSIEKALSVDVNNPVALNYYNELFQNKKRPEPVANFAGPAQAAKPAAAEQEAAQAAFKPITVDERKRMFDSFPIGEILAFAIGCVVIAILMITLYTPSRVDTKNDEIDKLQKELDTLSEEYAENKTDLEKLISEAETGLSAMETENEQLRSRVAAQDLRERVNSAANLVADENYLAAAEELSIIDLNEMPADLVERINELKVIVWPKVVALCFENGRESYESAEFDAAYSSLQKSLLYMTQESEIAPNIYYYLGLTAEKLEDFAGASEYYIIVMDDYPNSNQFNLAKTRYDQINQE